MVLNRPQTKSEHSLPSEAGTVIETETLLENCPHCGAWPMAAKLPSPTNQPEVRFRCVRCGHQEFGRLRRSGIRCHSRSSDQPGREARHRG